MEAKIIQGILTVVIIIGLVLLRMSALEQLNLREEVTEQDSYIEYLECEADIYGDTWRESDCGLQISREQAEFPCER